MKKILVTLDEETLQKIEDLKKRKLEETGLKWTTSEIIRYAIHKRWVLETIKGVEYDYNNAKEITEED